MAAAPRTRSAPPGGGLAIARSKRAALTASAVRLNRAEAETIRRVRQSWQHRAFLYYEQLGEIWFAAQFYAGPMSKLELNVAKINPDVPQEGEEDVETASLQDYVTRIQDPGGGRANLLGGFGRLMFLNGEALLVATKPEGDDDLPEQWEMLSTDELRADGAGGFQRQRAPSLGLETLQEEDDDVWEPVAGKCVAYRIWRRHPRFSELADAPMRGVLDLCEELLLLTMAVRARAVSRVAGAGILLLPEEISPAPPAPVGDEDPEEDPFLDELTKSMVTPIKDQGDASAVVPMVVRGQAQWLKEMRLLELSDPTKLYPETGLRTECIHRIAIGLDMPPSALEGAEDANHWTAWSIDEQTWKAHLQPIAQQLVDDLTAAYLRPAMRADGVANPEQYVITYDASAIINHPDRTKDAKDAWDRLAISDEALRKYLGLDEDNAPDEAEWLRRAGFIMHDSSMAAYGIPSVRANIEPMPGEIESAPGPQGGTTSAPGGAQATPAESAGTGPPAAPAGTEQQAAPAAMAASGAEVRAAMSVAVQRCRELAGNRIRNHTNGNEQAEALIDGVPAGLVASGLGRFRVASIAPGLTPRELVRGGAAPLVAALIDLGVGRMDAVAFAQAAERHAAQTLYSASPGRLELVES